MPDAVILLGVAGCVGYLVFGISRNGLFHPPIWSVLALGLPVALGVALVLALRLPRPARAKIALALGSCCVSVFAADLYFRFADDQRTRAARAARAAGRPLDHRTGGQVVRDLRAEGHEAIAFPWQLVNGTLTFARPDGRALPVLGGISGATTVLCNESGQFAIYGADEHGFNNPSGLHGRSPLQLALMGDSFTHGACVAREDSIAGHLRRAFPDTLNLGVAGSGPVSQLARFVEYAAPLRPRFVVWLWYEGNDLAEVSREISHAPLRRYLEDPTPLGLRDRQVDVNDAIRADRERRQGVPRAFRWLPRELRSMLTLRSLRRRLAAAGLPRLDRGRPGGRTAEDDLAVVEHVLGRVRDTSRGWGGELVMVYLPSFRPRSRIRHRERLFGLFEGLDLPVVDGRAAFAASGLPVETLRYFQGSHYSAAGYRVVADAVERELRARLAASPAAPSPP